MRPKSLVEFAQIDVSGRILRIEYAWVGVPTPAKPMLVFLHEGLGSVSMWKDFPQRLCNALDCCGLVYSRPGYGQSSARLPDERWGPDFMHVQALQVLPALLDALCVDQPVCLFGHSDGGSIALLAAAHTPHRVHSLVVVAPHIRVEPISVQSIRKTLSAYESGGLKVGLSKHHADADSAFYGWYEAWMNPAFLSWRIDSELENIRCPVLAIQGDGDEYGTFAQIDGIAAALSNTRLLKLPDCGHSPHKDQPQAVIDAVGEFLRRCPQAR